MNINFEKNKKVVENNKHRDDMLGDLCRDIARDMDFPWCGDADKVFNYLDSLVEDNGHYLKEPVRRFKISFNNTKLR